MTRGEVVNARARAGARMVHAREDWRKLRALSLAMPEKAQAARNALADAELDYAAALGAELQW